MLLLTTLADSQGTVSHGTNNIVQFFVVVVIFVFVLFLTAITTKWIGRYQKGQFTNRNMEVLETYPIAGNKFLQLVRVGETYMAIAVGKDTVTLLSEIPQEQIKLVESEKTAPVSFRTLLEKAQIKKAGKDDGPKDE